MKKEIMGGHGPQALGAESFAPSSYIKEEMDERGWSMEMLAKLAGLDGSVLRGVVEEDYWYQQSVAEGLARAFDTTAGYWMNLQVAHLAFTLYEMWAERQEGQAHD